MSLNKTFQNLKEKNEMALMPYVCVGDPDGETSAEIINAIIDAGADVMELGLPFSDPIADGPTIQAASERSLKSGMNTDRYFKVCKKVSGRIPFISMTYYNPILQYGLERFAQSCKESGISGIIVPDLPVEESGPLHDACKKSGIDLIFLVAPTTTETRMKKILKDASGFIYLVSLLGVTGARKNLGGSLDSLVKKTNAKTKLPVCVGFGISKPEHIKNMKGIGADGAIVGSAVIDVIAKNKDNRGKMLEELSMFIGKLKSATKD
ncbi:MAG: tryptophan synthase subunit alpha [Candidatus Altiarchaeales archaeon IMC4]|nr:MAG: tryptophan synthase subunit alpha [Candidatus Altiarchaeales archaeon IMC4]